MDTPEPAPAAPPAEFVAALPLPRQVDWRAYGALVLVGVTVATIGYDRSPVLAVSMVGAFVATFPGRARLASIVPAAAAMHAVTATATAFVHNAGSLVAEAWWRTATIPLGVAVLLTVLVVGALWRRALRIGPAATLLLVSAGAVLIAADAVPDDLLGLDIGTIVAALAVADRTATLGLRRPGDPGPVERSVLVLFALLPAGVAAALGPTTAQPALLIALTTVWTTTLGVGLGVASRRESRLRRTTDDLTALTALFVDSEDRGVLSVGEGGEVLAANAAAESMLGAPGVTIVGHSVDEFVRPHRRTVHAGHRRSFRSGRATRPMSASGPVEATTLAGELVVVRIALRRVTGEHDRMMAVVENLTARRAEAEELRTRLERQEALLGQLRRLEALRTGILTAASHELRTPVTVLHGTTELLAARLADLPPETRDILLQRQLAQSTRLVALLDDLVAVDPDGEIATHPRVVAVNHTVASITERWSRRNEGFPVTVLGHKVNAWSDPSALERIITTLLDNARTHGAAPVAVQVLPHEGGAQVLVSDSGAGIPVDLHEEIFQPFGRGLTIDEANPGLGLGLPLARMLAEADGGTLQAMRVPSGAQLQLTLARPPADKADARIEFDGTLGVQATAPPTVTA